MINMPEIEIKSPNCGEVVSTGVEASTKLS